MHEWQVLGSRSAAQALGMKVGSGPGATTREGRPGVCHCGEAKVGNEPIWPEFYYAANVGCHEAVKNLQQCLGFGTGFVTASNEVVFNSSKDEGFWSYRISSKHHAIARRSAIVASMTANVAMSVKSGRVPTSTIIQPAISGNPNIPIK